MKNLLKGFSNEIVWPRAENLRVVMFKTFVYVYFDIKIINHDPAATRNCSMKQRFAQTFFWLRNCQSFMKSPVLL